MPLTLTNLGKRLRKDIHDIQKKASETAGLFAQMVVTDLTEETPVDTSKALSNWQSSLDFPNRNQILPHFPGSKGSTEVASGKKADEISARILKSKKVGQIIYITNNVDYIEDLNDGASKQAAPHFVEAIIKVRMLDIPLIYRGR